VHQVWSLPKVTPFSCLLRESSWFLRIFVLVKVLSALSSLFLSAVISKLLAAAVTEVVRVLAAAAVQRPFNRPTA
jgi:hypothetical protein